MNGDNLEMNCGFLNDGMDGSPCSNSSINL
jgi:hypothetical protein